MKAKRMSFKRGLIWGLLLTLIAGLLYATGTELMKTSKAATTAANNGVDQEMAVIESTTVKPQSNSNIAWGKIQQLEKQLKQNSTQYKQLISKASSEKEANDGNVTDATRQAGQASAQKFSQISEELAATWEKGNCITRAKTVRATAKSRLANAEVAFNNVNSDAISKYNEESNLMSEANIESMKDVKADASPADLAKLKDNLVPQLNKMISDNTALVKQVGELFNQVRQMASGDVGAMAGCAKSVVSGAVTDGPAGLLKPLTSLLNLVKGMGSNLATTLKAVTAL